MKYGETICQRVCCVTDHEDSTGVEHAKDCLQETRFILRIKVSCGFVEQKHGTIAEKFPCKS